MRYFWATIRHKWLVFLAGLRTGLPLWRSLIHDLSKFTRAELSQYDRQFFGDQGDPEGFALAWLHHQNCNSHHWEYYVTRSDHSHGGSGAVDGCLPMPAVDVIEMVTDWMGASRAYTGSWAMGTWLEENLPRMRMHPDTRRLVYQLLFRLGYCDECYFAGGWNEG